MLRVVVDTNIYISAFLFGGKPLKALEYAQEGKYLLFTSEFILDEVKGVLEKKFNTPKGYTEQVIKNILGFSHLIVPKIKIDIVRNDPSDNRILECAVTAKANIIVSGDKDLLFIKNYQDITILKAEGFLRNYVV